MYIGDKGKGKVNKEKVKSGHKIGENGTRTSSDTMAQKSTTERIGVENPNPGQQDGQIHYHDLKIRNIYDIAKKVFLDDKGENLDSNSIWKLLKQSWIQKAIQKGLKYLGED